MCRRAITLAFLMLLMGCSTGSGTDTGAGFVSGSGTVDFPAGEREPAPAVRGTTLDGRTVALDDLDGVVVLNFWASWCGPCAVEAPDLVAIHERYHERGVRLLGVNVRDSLANARSFERDFDIPYPSLHDRDSAIAAAFGGIGPSALPTTIIVDADGAVASRLFGAVTAEQLGRRLDELVAEAGGAGTGARSGSVALRRPAW